MYARKRGWLVMVADGWRQAQYGWFIEPYKFRREVPGTDDVYDNAFMSAELLRGFYKAHKDVLSTIPIENASEILEKYQPELNSFREAWERTVPIAPPNSKFIDMRRIIEDEENFPEEDALDEDILGNFAYADYKCKSLADLVVLGLFYRDFAGAVAMDLIDQLKNLESHRVLFVVDSYNSWEVPSVYKYEYKTIMPKQLCVPRALNFLSKQRSEMTSWKQKNGFAIGFTSHKHPPLKKDVFHDAMRSFDLVMKVPVYTSSEYLAAMRYYLEKAKLFEPDVTNHDIIAFRMMCSSNPRLTRLDAFRYLTPLFASRQPDMEDYDDHDVDDVVLKEKSGKKGDDNYSAGFDDLEAGDSDNDDNVNEQGLIEIPF